MSKMMGMVIGAIDNFMPGYKTYVIWVIAMGMMGCQMMGFHAFTPEMWSMVGITVNEAIADGDDNALTLAFDKLRLEAKHSNPKRQDGDVSRRYNKTMSGE